MEGFVLFDGFEGGLKVGFGDFGVFFKGRSEAVKVESFGVVLRLVDDFFHCSSFFD